MNCVLLFCSQFFHTNFATLFDLKLCFSQICDVTLSLDVLYLEVVSFMNIEKTALIMFV